MSGSDLASSVWTDLDASFGAETSSFDLSRPLSTEARADLLRMLAKRHLLVFRGQRLTDAQYLAFGQSFGELEGSVIAVDNGQLQGKVTEVRNIDADGKPFLNPYLRYNYYWHSDKAYLPEPSWITMLYALALPAQGGDTQFADASQAYDALPAATKARIHDLVVINSHEHMLETLGNYRHPDDVRRVPDAQHPLVRIHPATGRKSLFVTMYAKGIVGMPEAEARDLLDSLLAHATQPRFVHNYKWRLNDVILWDNGALIHRAVRDFDVERELRWMKRLVVRGSSRPAVQSTAA